MYKFRCILVLHFCIAAFPRPLMGKLNFRNIIYLQNLRKFHAGENFTVYHYYHTIYITYFVFSAAD